MGPSPASRVKRPRDPSAPLEILQQYWCKMITPMPQHKRQTPAEQIKFVVIGQPLRLGARQIDRQRQRDRPDGLGIQDADAARLDSAADRLGTVGKQPSLFVRAQQHPVIRNQSGTECHHFNGKRRFAHTGGTQDQQSPARPGHARAMQDQACAFNHRSILFPYSAT